MAEVLARVAVAVAEAQAALEEVAQAGPAPVAGQERAAADRVTMDRAAVDRVAVDRVAVDRVAVDRVAEDPVHAAEALPSVAAVSAAGERNPVNGWRLQPCCAAPR